MWKYDLADWHESLAVPHERWWADLLAQGWEPEYPDRREGSLIALNGRTVQRHSVVDIGQAVAARPTGAEEWSTPRRSPESGPRR